MNNMVQVPFHGDTLLAVKDEQGQVWVALKRMCESLGLAYEAQFTKLKTKRWAGITMIVTPDAKGVGQRTFCLNLDSVPMWLATIDTNRVAPDVASKLEQYQLECASVLRDHFFIKSDAPPNWMGLFMSSMTNMVSAFMGRLDGIEAKLQGGTPVIIPAEEMSKFKRTLNDVCRQAVTAGLFGTFRKARYNFETRIRRAAGWPRSAGATLERMPSSAWHYAHVELSEILNEVKRFGSAQLKLILDDETDPKAH
jgi:hypothetical protein